jgi:hypothetical protein
VGKKGNRKTDFFGKDLLFFGYGKRTERERLGMALSNPCREKDMRKITVSPAANPYFFIDLRIDF